MTQQSHCWAYTPRKLELKETCVPQCSSQQFTIARTWKQPRCPSADEWIRKLFLYTVEHYSTIIKNAFESKNIYIIMNIIMSIHVYKEHVYYQRIKLEPIIQSEVSQKEKQCTNAYTWNLERW